MRDRQHEAELLGCLAQQASSLGFQIDLVLRVFPSQKIAFAEFT